MSEQQQILGLLIILIPLVGAQIVNIIIAIKTGKKTDDNTASLIGLLTKADVIKETVDGRSSRQEERIRSLEDLVRAYQTSQSQAHEVAKSAVEAAKSVNEVKEAVQTAAGVLTHGAVPVVSVERRVDQRSKDVNKDKSKES